MVHQLQPDLYMNAVIRALCNRPNVTEIQVNKEGLWRAAEGEEWQDIRHGPAEFFDLPPKREDVVPDGDCGASSSSCPSRGQKRAREELPKVPVVAPLNGHGQGGGGQTGPVIPAELPQPSNPAGAAQAVRKPPEKTTEVITISDSDDDDTAVPAAAAVAASHPAHVTREPRQVPNVPASRYNVSSVGVMPPALPSAVPPVHLQQHRHTQSAQSAAAPVHHRMPLSPAMMPITTGMPAQLVVSALPQAQPTHPSHTRSAPTPPASENKPH